MESGVYSHGLIYEIQIAVTGSGATHANPFGAVAVHVPATGMVLTWCSGGAATTVVVACGAT